MVATHPSSPLGASNTLIDVGCQILPDPDDEPAAWLASRSDDIASVLDRIPGAWERMQLGREQAACGEAVELGELLTALPSRETEA